MTSYLFPGQGAQYGGMGKDLYDSSPQACQIFERADELLGWSLSDLMFDGSDEDLSDTRITQLSIFVHSIASLEADANRKRPDIVAGHSLGEYSALVAAGVLTFDDALTLVEARGKCMAAIDGAMAAIIGLPSFETERVCSRLNDVYIANYNCLEQTIISGSRDILPTVCEAAQGAGARHAFLLDVSIPSHCPLMQSAQDQFAPYVNKTIFRQPICPICQNVDGELHTDCDEIKRNLLAQMVSPVRWRESMMNMMKTGVTDFVEYGPGDTLTELTRKIKKGI